MYCSGFSVTTAVHSDPNLLSKASERLPAIVSPVFRAAREEALGLAREMQRSRLARSTSARQNDLRPLTVNEWFVYIRDHSARESVRVREKAVARQGFTRPIVR